MLKGPAIATAVLMLVGHAGTASLAHAQTTTRGETVEAFVFMGGLRTVVPARYESFQVEKSPVLGVGGGVWIAVGSAGGRGLQLGLEIVRGADSGVYRPFCASAGQPCPFTARRSVTSMLVMGDIAYQFSRGRLRPYVAGGSGLLVCDIQVLGDGNIEDARYTDYVQTVDAAAGVKIFLTRSLSIDPEFRAAFSKEHSATSFGVGVGYHW